MKQLLQKILLGIGGINIGITVVSSILLAISVPVTGVLWLLNALHICSFPWQIVYGPSIFCLALNIGGLGLAGIGMIATKLLPGSSLEVQKNESAAPEDITATKQRLLKDLHQKMQARTAEEQYALLIELYKRIALQMAAELRQDLPFFSNQRLNKEQEFYLLFEIFAYLCFYTDVIASDRDQPSNSRPRKALRVMIIQSIMEPGFYIRTEASDKRNLLDFPMRDESLRALFINRLEEYFEQDRIGSAVLKPVHLFLHQLQVLGNNQNINRSSSIPLPLGNPIERVANAAILASNDALAIFCSCLNVFFDVDDFTVEDAQQTAWRIRQGVERADLPKSKGLQEVV